MGLCVHFPFFTSLLHMCCLAVLLGVVLFAIISHVDQVPVCFYAPNASLVMQHVLLGDGALKSFQLLSMGDADPLPVSLSELDIMDDFPLSGGWAGTPDFSDLLEGISSSTSPFVSSGNSQVIEISNSGSNRPVLIDTETQEGAERSLLASLNPSKNEVEAKKLVDLGMAITTSSELDSSRWIQPKTQVALFMERLNHAVNCIRESQKGDVLVQLWLPVKIGERRVLSTSGQPFSVNRNCQNLIKYRKVSMKYQFSAEENSSVALSMPGRVFLGRVPEWTPDVQYFTIDEYLRLYHAQRCDVRGTIVLPIFESSSCSCLGVVEVVSAAQKINYRSDLESICNALEAVDLRTCDVYSIPRIQAKSDSYKAALPEILEVLRAVCHKHGLPLAQTWIPCTQQGKTGRHHSEENYQACVSTVDVACYVNDSSMQCFHEACSEHHLFKGQGVAGKAFTTNHPCFSPDISAFRKIEYPLSHLAKLFHLLASVAIRLRSIHTGTADFVLEFFLPVSCRELEEQKATLNSMSITIQQTCQSLRVVTVKELEEEDFLQANDSISLDIQFDKPEAAQRSYCIDEEPSCIAGICETQHKEARNPIPVFLPLEFSEAKNQEVSFSGQWHQSGAVLPAGKIFSELPDLIKDVTHHENAFHSEPTTSSDNATERKQTKTEKIVSLQVLQQYFSRNLKDAAKSIGVSPTTLKRICRQNGIKRWPSRKIKKVGHSLKKLQVVLDSVQGTEGPIQFSSLYENFIQSSNPEIVSSKRNEICTSSPMDCLESYNAPQEKEVKHSHISATSSSTSSCSLGSSTSLACSSGSKQGTDVLYMSIKQEVADDGEGPSDRFGRAGRQLELQHSAQGPAKFVARSQRPTGLLGEHPHLNFLKIKAVYGEEIVRFRLLPNWRLEDLKQEIVRKFSISDTNFIRLKYMDDDFEWILLTCDADLQECISLHGSAGDQTVKVSIHHAAQ